MLNIENITVKISNSIILRDINMIAKKGLITCIMGKNGMGKTTLLETIIGHHVLSSGSIRFNHTNIEKLSPFEKHEKMRKEQEYVLSKIRDYQEMHKQSATSITDLPVT